MATVEVRLTLAALQALADLEGKVEAEWIDGAAEVIFEVIANQARGAVDACVGKAEGVDA